MQKQEYITTLGNKELKVIFSDLAEKANGSAMVQLGDSVVLATAVMSDEDAEGLNYFPLTVDYEERFYAAGQILGSRFIRREGRPSEEAILSGRLVDRTIRPLFDQTLRRNVQVIITILSLGEYDPDILAVLASSLAIAVSDIPWRGPVSAIRLSKTLDNDTFIVNPTYTERGSQNNLLDLVACGRDGTINMIEAGAKEVQEKTLTDALIFAEGILNEMQKFQEKIVAEIGKKKAVITAPQTPEELKTLFDKEIAPKLNAAVFSGPGKAGISALGKEWKKLAADRLPDVGKDTIVRLYDEKINDILHDEAIHNARRPDGRSVYEIRPLYAQAGGLSGQLHGLGIFYRGGTHVLSALTLGGPHDSLVIDGMEIQTKKHFLHHYNFPPFAPGETGRMGGLNRRMIGHGALAEKALTPVLPPKEIFPYTIRIVSEVMASNGSTSMASVCGGTLALMDGGVPISKPVAGIASGIMYKNPKEYALITDIQGPEDEHGDMDFKVAGTRDGVTAIQMDVKVDGIPTDLLAKALEKAKVARLQILDVIEKEITTPRPSIAASAPKVVIAKIKPDQIGMVIGPGGKMINQIRDMTSTEIEIEEDGTIYITGKEQGPEKAKEMIVGMTREYVPGERLTGPITRIADFGAFVRLGPNTEGLVHVSEIAPFRVERVSQVLQVGQEVPVVVKEVGDGRVSLSIRQADPDFVKMPEGTSTRSLHGDHSRKPRAERR
jgi:polyribonucleotide nucleotidyltransferase